MSAQVTTSLLAGVGYATANLKDLFPGHQMPAWILTLTCVEKLPVYFSIMAAISQVARRQMRNWFAWVGMKIEILEGSFSAVSTPISQLNTRWNKDLVRKRD